jgi:hypothetical protein
VGVLQTYPLQQSASMVQDWPGILQTGPPSGISMQRSAPIPSGTQGTPLQQSAADAQVSPVLRHVPPRPLQRGTPRASSWQTPELPGAAQQSLRAAEMLQA